MMPWLLATVSRLTSAHVLYIYAQQGVKPLTGCIHLLAIGLGTQARATTASRSDLLLRPCVVPVPRVETKRRCSFIFKFRPHWFVRIGDSWNKTLNFLNCWAPDLVPRQPDGRAVWPKQSVRRMVVMVNCWKLPRHGFKLPSLYMKGYDRLKHITIDLSIQL